MSSSDSSFFSSFLGAAAAAAGAAAAALAPPAAAAGAAAPPEGTAASFLLPSAMRVLRSLPLSSAKTLVTSCNSGLVRQVPPDEIDERQSRTAASASMPTDERTFFTSASTGVLPPRATRR